MSRALQRRLKRLTRVGWVVEADSGDESVHRIVLVKRVIVVAAPFKRRRRSARDNALSAAIYEAER